MSLLIPLYNLIYRFLRKSPLSVIAFGVLILLFCRLSYQLGSWRNNRSIIHDITSYYSYVPAVFIYQDLSFDFRYDLPQNEPLDHLWVNVKSDTVFQKMSIGLAYFYTPTFLIAHLYTAYNSEYNRNGFSKPYQLAMNVNTLLIGILGAFVLKLFLRSLYSDTVTAISLLAIYAGTNLLYYISGAPGLSHPYSLFLLVLLVLLCFRFFRKPQTGNLLLIGIIAGWIVLIRPTNLLLCLIPFLLIFDRNNYHSVRAYFLAKPGRLLYFAVAFLIPWIPQFLYWYQSTGHVFFYSYDEEGFFFNKPHIIDGLFSYRKGWFVYTPLMFFAFIGLFLSEYKTLARSILLIFLPFLFVIFSWWCWWYGGSFGSRVMIETYVFMAVGLAAIIKIVLRKGIIIKSISALVLVFIIVLNTNQIRQYSYGMLHWDAMTKKAYWSIFMKDTPPPDFEELLEHPDYSSAMQNGE